MKNLKKDQPLVSIVIATHNSQRVLKIVLDSIVKQKYPKQKIEILIIDGKSSDGTLEIAKKYGCKIIINTKVDQVYAKHLGYLKARGKYLMFLDSDEVLDNTSSLNLKVEEMRSNPELKAVISSGYQVPENYPSINMYLSDIGDPFTFFMYRDSKDPRFFLNNLKNNYKVLRENKTSVIFDFFHSSSLPFIELTSMAVLIDLDYVKTNLPEVLKRYSLHTHLFYLLNNKQKHFAVMKNDRVSHFSASTVGNYLKKINSRIKNNIYGTDMGTAGFKGREPYDSNWHSFKKILFGLYVLSLLPVIIDSVYLALSRGKLVYLLHFPIGLYSMLMIFYYYTLKMLGIKPKLVGYGD